MTELYIYIYFQLLIFSFWFVNNDEYDFFIWMLYCVSKPNKFVHCICVVHWFPVSSVRHFAANRIRSHKQWLSCKPHRSLDEFHYSMIGKRIFIGHHYRISVSIYNHLWLNYGYTRYCWYSGFDLLIKINMICLYRCCIGLVNPIICICVHWFPVSSVRHVAVDPWKWLSCEPQWGLGTFYFRIL